MKTTNIFLKMNKKNLIIEKKLPQKFWNENTFSVLVSIKSQKCCIKKHLNLIKLTLILMGKIIAENQFYKDQYSKTKIKSEKDVIKTGFYANGLPPEKKLHVQFIH